MNRKKPNLKPPAWARLSDRAFLVWVLAAGAIARVIGLAHASIWHDEGYTMMLAVQSPAQIWHRTGLDVHPPLYYLSLHYWMQIFGTSELAARGWSTVLMLGAIVCGFLLVRRLFGSRAARLGAVFMAFAPFLIRYSQEARMYGMLAFIATLSTYLLVKAQDTNRRRDWLWYGLSVAAGLYTYYYVIFMIVFHWAYMAFLAVWPRLSWRGLRATILSPNWIGANALAVVLWLPWIPTAYAQVTQIQSPPWIPKATLNTLPSTFGQFLTYTDMGRIVGIRDLLFLALAGLALALLWQQRRNPAPTILMILYTALTPVLVWLLSFGAHPKYVDRYFVFAAVAFYLLLGVILTVVKPWQNKTSLRYLSIIIVLAVFGVGIRNVYSQGGSHGMRELMHQISLDGRPDDGLVAGDFYTFFDGRYYALQDGLREPQVWVTGNFPGCCEGRSLLYDQPQTVVKDLADIHPASGYEWVFGRPGQQDYFDKVPANWQPAGPQIVVRDVAAQRFLVR